MKIALRRSVVEGRVQAPASKSHTHRAYILGALSGNGSVLRPLHSDDTRATLEALQGLGFLVSNLPHEVRVGGALHAPKRPLHARSSGTTLRLITALSALLRDEVRIEADPQLERRPMAPLLSALESLGAQTQSTRGHAPLSVRGPLRGGQARVAADESSQYVSALLLSLPVATGSTDLVLEGPIKSAPYVDITLFQLREHGVRVDRVPHGFHIPGEQRVRQRPFSVPGDYSSAAFLLAAAAVTGGSVTVTNLRADDPQGDRAVLELLRRFGAHVEAGPEQVTVKGGPLEGCDIDVGDVPDLFPVLCAVASVSVGTTRLTGAPHLRLKESDRVHAMASNLARAGIEARERPDGIEIRGGIPKGIVVEPFADHRIAMACAVLALASEGESVIPDGNVFSKSYPNFHNDLLSIAPEVARA